MVTAMDSLAAFLLESPGIGATISIAAALGATLGVYFLMHAWIGASASADAEIFSRSMIARLGTIQGLILALMFAQEISDYRDIRTSRALEINAIGDVY